MDSSKIDIGRHPLLNSAIYILTNVCMYAVAVFLMFRGGTFFISLGIVMLLFALATSYYTALYAFASIIFCKMFNRTHRCIKEFKMTPSWFVNSWGYIVVDETKKMLILNGEVFHYSDVASIERISQDNFPNHVIVVNLNKGELPVKKVALWNKTQTEQFYQRLANSLNFA